jgi:TRAP-type C4-dicarboxylate transport system permease large subunit
MIQNLKRIGLIGVVVSPVLFFIAMPIAFALILTSFLFIGHIRGGMAVATSVVFILYGLLTNMSIGDLFIASFIPGLLMTVCFIITIFFWTRIQPNAGPAGAISG